MVALYRTKIFRRQFFAFAGLSCIFFGSMGVVIALKTRSTIEERQIEVSTSYRREVAIHLLDWVKERRDDIAFFASELGFDDLDRLSTEALSVRLAALPRNNSSFEDVFTIDADGYIDSSYSGVAPHKIYVGDRDYAKAAMAGNSSIEGYLKSRLTGSASYAIAAPLHSARGGPVALVGIIKLSKVSVIVAEVDIAAIGQAYLVDGKSRVISDPAFESRFSMDDLSNGAFVLNNAATSALAQGQSGSCTYESRPGFRVFGSYEPITPLGLGLVVEFSATKALRPVTSLLAFTAIFMLATIVVLVGISWLLASRLIAPIGLLIEAERSLTNGNFQGPLCLTTNTEFDLLVELFNRMAEAVQERENVLKDSAARDSLTGLYNHGRIEEFLELEMRRSRRSNGLVSFVMIDIDHFKLVNDNHGHQAGDEVLRRLAAILKANAREGDLVGRYGGEEFAVILPLSSPEETQAFCERIRGIVEASPIVFGELRLSITVSLGWTALRPVTSEPYDVIHQADKALYEAKSAGRNTVRGSSPPSGKTS